MKMMTSFARSVASSGGDRLIIAPPLLVVEKLFSHEERAEDVRPLAFWALSEHRFNLHIDPLFDLRDLSFSFLHTFIVLQYVIVPPVEIGFVGEGLLDDRMKARERFIIDRRDDQAITRMERGKDEPLHAGNRRSYPT